MDTLSTLMKYSAGAAQKQTSGSSNGSNTIDVLSRYGKGMSVAPVSQYTGEKQQNDGGFLGGLGYLGEKIGLGFLSGIEGIWDYTAGGLAKLFGADDWAEQQFSNDWVNYNHADEWFNPSKGWQVAGDVAGGIGTSLPALAGVAAAAAIAYFSVGSLSGVSAGIISGVIAGFGAAGNATKQAYRQTGELGGKEFGYGFLSGLTEGAVEGLSAGIGAGTGAIAKNITKSFGKEVAKSAARETAKATGKTLAKEAGKQVLLGFVGEAFEEGLSEFLDPYWKRMTYDPSAKNATIQEIGYAALIGGLSGAIMSGVDVSVRSTVNTVRGSNIVNNGKASDVITTAENIVGSDAYTDQYESFQNVKSLLTELQTSMEKTGGEIRTLKQKTLLGYLERANTFVVFEPMIQRNAARIVTSAEAVAERLTKYGYKDANGNPIVFTPEQIRSGFDVNNPKTFAEALKKNNVLRTLAVIDTTGQLYMDTKAFEQATLRGEGLSSQVDLNRFIETATKEELDSVAERLEIADWQGLTNEQFKEKIVAFSQNGGVETYQTEQTKKAELRADAEAVSPEKAKKRIPKSFTTKNDGVVRYSQNGVDMAVIKDGDAYRIFDYEKGRLSKAMTLEQLNFELAKIKEGLESELTRLQESQTETRERQEAAEIDAYATENISAYSKLSDANKSLVRGVIRQARAAGISDADALSYARVSAKAGVNISFDKHAKVNDSEILIVGENEQTGAPVYADGCYYHETNTIYVNPEAKRSHEALLIHELTHAIYRSKGGAVILMKGVENMSDADKKAIAKKYAGQGSVAIVDEINAHFAEGQLTNKKLLQRLTEDAPTLKQRILAFFKKSAAAYSEDERLTGAAKKLYKQYKKLFDSFAEGKKGRKGYAGNQGNNSFETPTAPKQQFGRFSFSGDEYEIAESTVGTDGKGKYLSINLSSEAQTKYSGLNIRERSDFVKRYIKDTFRNIEFTLTDGKKVVVTGRDAGKMSNTTFEAKHRTTLELDRLFEIAEYTSSNEQPDHGPFSRFDYYSARVKIGDDVYTCVLNVGAEKTGGSLRLHDVNQFKLLKKEAPTQLNEQTTSASSLESLRSTSLDNSISENGENVNPKGKKGVRYALSDEQIASVKKRGVKGDKLLDVQDLADTITDVGGEITTDGKAVLYHATNAEAAKKIRETGKMIGKEDRLYFSTKKDGQIKGYGDTVVKVKIPLELLELNDYFRDEAHLTIETRPNKPTNIRYALPDDVAGVLFDDEFYDQFRNEDRTKISETLVELEALRNGKEFDELSWDDQINTVHKIKALKAGYISQYDYFVGTAKDRIAKDYAWYTERGEKYPMLERKKASAERAAKLQKDIAAASPMQNAQFQIIQDTNPMWDDQHVGIRSPLEIRTFAEVIDDTDSFNWGDFSKKDAERALKRGTVRIYSSYPIKNGVFVSTSYQQALDYAGGDASGVHSRVAALDSVAWINGDEGQYAKVYKKEAIRYALPDTVESDIVEHYGKTYRWTETGYLLKDGTRVDLSGRNEGASGGYRSIDHRDVFDGYDVDGTDAMVEFMSRGNIRVMPEGPAINMQLEPTEEQYRQIGNLVETLAWKEKEFTVDFDDNRGNTVDSLSYEGSVSWRKVVSDIRYYFKEGKVPYQSDLSKFRYALPEADADGERLSAQQIEFFKNSAVVDEDGKLLPVYHSTNNYEEIDTWNEARRSWDTKYTPFTEFKKTYSEQVGHFFGKDINNAGGYGNRIYKVYLNLINPLIIDCKGSSYSDIAFNGKHKDTYEWAAYAKKEGYDGVIFKNIRDGVDYGAMQDATDEYVAFRSSQIKLTTNKTPTTNRDIRFALPDDTDEGSMGGYSRGQRAKFAANNTALKVYSRADAEAVINEIMEERFIFEDDGQYGEISARTRDEVVDYLFRKLNTVKEGYRIPVALNIADYLIEHATIVDMYADGVASEAIQELQVYRSFMHRIDLSGIQKEIEYTFDKRNGINMVWGAPKGKGIAPDTLGMELEEYGIFLKGDNEADLFIQLVERYRKARDLVAEGVKKQTLLDVGSKKKLEELRQKIARDILIAYDERGTQSKYGKLVEKYTAQIDSLKQQVKNNRRDNAMRNRIIDDAKYLREIAEKRSYVSADVFNAPELTAWLKLLGRLQFRSDLRKTGVRQILLDYGKFYNTENPLLYDADPNLTYIDNNVLDALALIRQNENSTKELSFEELQAAQVIMASAKHLFQNYDQMILEGRKVRISEVAAQGNEILLRSKNHVGRGFFNGIYGVFNKIVEPRVVIKSLENYDPRGILTRAYSEITKGETEAGVLYIRLVENFDAFFAKNKSYKKRFASEYLTVGGKRLTVGQAISLYELSKREQARAGLFEAGFSFMDEKGAKQSVTITQSDIDALAQTFTETDKQFIAVVEEFFNVRSKQVKTEADLEILGYTNASEDFYFPIKRDSGTIAKNITDARDIMADWANVYNFSFNKDVKKGAANKLFITDVYSVVTRHAQQLSTYAKLTVPLKNFSQIYSRNIGTKTNVITIRNTINERVWGGAENYLRKLFSDIQGKTTSSSFIEKLRGAYAKYQLGANAKVIVSQVTSYPTAAILLDVDCLARGAVMKTNYAAMDEYCGFAKVRNYEKGIVKAEGVIDTVGKLGDLFTKPIQWTDRLTIGKLWNACQVQVQKTNGYKIGTVENMTAAGVLLEEVTRLTQPNYSNSERSELMRSDSDIVRSFTMFTSVPLKQLSRLVESVGEFTALRQMIRSGDSSVEVAERYKVAKRKLGRTIAAITVANMFYVLVGQFFKWLFDKDRKDKDGNEISFVKDLLNDFVSTTVGMLPIVRDIYNFFANDYEFNNFAYETVNNVLTASKELFEMASKAASGEDMSKSDFGKPLRDSLYAIGQITGLPFRNINNQISGLVKHFNPSAAYKYNSMFYNAQYSKDIKKALEKGDTELANTIMSMLLNESRTGDLNDAARGKLTELYGKGYTVLPRTVGNSITYNGETVPMTEQQRKQFVSICSQANGYIEKMVASPRFEKLPEDRQAKAIKSVYDAYYYQAVSDLLGTDANNTLGDLSQYIALDKLAIAFSELSEITSDVDKNGNVINGSKKKKTIAYLLKQNLTDGERLLILYYRGYTILDGDFKGYTKKRARTVLLKYILGLKATAAQKAQIASECGFTVKNGKIVRSSV